MRRRRLVQTGLAVPLVYLLFCAIVGIVIAEIALCPPRHRHRLEMVNYADIFLARGHSVLMPDARAHGNSRPDTGHSKAFDTSPKELENRAPSWLGNHRRPLAVSSRETSHPGPQ